MNKTSPSLENTLNLFCCKCHSLKPRDTSTVTTMRVMLYTSNCGIFKRNTFSVERGTSCLYCVAMWAPCWPSGGGTRASSRRFTSTPGKDSSLLRREREALSPGRGHQARACRLHPLTGRRATPLSQPRQLY